MLLTVNKFIEKIKCISMTLFIAHSEKRVINYPPQVLGSLTTGKIPKVDTLLVFGHLIHNVCYLQWGYSRCS